MKMKIRIIYGLGSYAVASVLLFFPLFSSPEATAAARVVPFLSGAFLLAGTAFTDYELGMIRHLRFRDTAIMTVIGCALELFSVLFISYGDQLRLITLMAACLGVISLLAYRTHGFSRQEAV